MNYGHALRFGLHLPSDADCGPGRLVAAGLAEQRGLDLLVVPAGTAGDDLEPSTVVSWIAGATVSLRLVLEAHPATLHPAMLARAVAGLDRLTEGRVGLCISFESSLRPERIAAARSAAGREPAAVSRLLNLSGRFTSGAGGGLLEGTPGDWAEQIADLALRYGVSGFILATDEPADLNLFGHEVAPRARELVESERVT
ncbi:LLM class flavin-dependent oxidoreductase [Streptomyces olivaceus]